ncbi:serine hydrolase [Caulobacter endophyticus]|uniref:Serine hydrolase n=2 Tax=Caulobacter endophyticus TaxID=2172652 RepID=A0A2T9JLU0_9CAUL|nr:serine hydrolase [Caulobacter endophyticus]
MGGVLPVLAAPLPADKAREIDAIAAEVLAATGAPSASVAVIEDGEPVYAKAYGLARLSPAIPATTSTRYGIASVSKQFTAAAVLLLVEDGKVSLDDPVSKYVSGLTNGDRITLRQVLSHTAGYRDYWPQDFVFETMRAPTTQQKILDGWARIPLDYPPGEQWRYSNTGFVIAGLVVEKVAGEPLLSFLRRRIFDPLGMAGVTEDDTKALSPPDAGHYTRYGLGPVVPADKEGPGWLFGAAELAMSPSDLARWNRAMIRRELLKPASWTAMTTSVDLSNGTPAGYGLGVSVRVRDGVTTISHGGMLSGVLTSNTVWPAEKRAVTVVANADFGDPQTAISQRIAFLLRSSTGAAATARTLMAQLQAGTIDQALLTANGKAWFTPARLADFKASLAPLGPLRMLEGQGVQVRGGMTWHGFDAAFGTRTLSVSMRLTPDGKVEQFLVGPKAS